MAYSKHTWDVGEPITKEKMNNIETGLENTSNVADSASSLATEVKSIVGYSAAEAQNGTVKQRIKELSDAQDLLSNNASTVTKLVEIIKMATGANDINNSTNNNILLTILDGIDQKFNPIKTLVEQAKGTSASLPVRLNSMDTTISDQGDAIGSISQEISNAHRNGNDTLDSRFDDIENEINGAHNNSISGDTLGSRFSRIEQTIGTFRDVIGQEDNTVPNNWVDMKTQLSNINTELTGSHTSETNAASYNSLDARLEAIEADINTKNYNLNENITDLDSRLNKIDGGNALTGNKTLAFRVGEVEDEIANAHNSAANNETYDSLDARFEAVESKANAAAVAEAVNTRLDAIDGGTTFDSANGTLAAHVNAIETAIDYTPVDQNDETPAGLTQRITAVETTVGDNNNGLVQTVNGLVTTVGDNSAGLVKRVSDAETAIGSIEDNIGSGFDSANTVAAAIATKANSSDVNTALAAKADISTINTISTTIVVDKTKVDFDTDNRTPISFKNNSGITLNDKDDYLIQENTDDGKYYYWKHINNAWHLMGGAGNGGGGNTSGYDLSEADYNELVTHTENTDYYVSKTDGVHHYRWVLDENDTLVEIEISNFIDTTNIKKYNATTSTTGEGDEQVTYLDLYEFNYGVDNTVIDPQASTLRAHIPLPKGGGGSNNNITARLVRIGDETVPTIVNSNVNLYAFFSAWDSDQSYSGNYTLKYNNTAIKTGTFASGAVNATPINWIVVEDPEFNDNVPVISSPDSTKLYIVKTGDTFTQWTYVNNNWSSVAGAPAGFYALDISEYCKTASINNTFTLVVNYGTDNPSLGKSWQVNIYDLYIESDAPETLLIRSTESYNFEYTPFGALTKTLHVLVDNYPVGTKNLISSTSGRPDTFTITPQMIENASGNIHGVHKIEMYLTADIGGINKTTSKIVRDYIWYDVNDTETPIIIASPYRGQTLNIQQYSTVAIPYQVYQKDTNEITVQYYLDNTLLDEVHLNDVNSSTFNYLATAAEGSHTLKLMVEDEYIEINLVIEELDINIAPISNAIIDFDPSSLSNSSINRLPSWIVDQTTYSFTASPNFNWSEDISGGGYKVDENNEKCFVIKAGSYIDLNYPMFANNVFADGAEMKITFKTAAVRNAEAVWYKNIGEISGKTVGIQLNAHNGWLKTDKAVSTTTIADEDSDEDTITVKGITYTYWKVNTAYNVNDIRVIRNIIYRCTGANEGLATNLQDKSIDLDEDPAKSYLKKWLKIGQLDTEVLSTNSYLYFPYSEGDKIELDININKSAPNNNFIMSYEDGVPSKAYAYTMGTGGDKIAHNNTIRIGSDDCDVYIYRLRYYAEALTTDQILQNFIADGSDVEEKVNRYNRNCIYWDNTQQQYFTSPSPTAYLDPVKLAERMPNVKILMLETPTFTTGKKDFVQYSTLRCLHAQPPKDYKGDIIYKSRGDADNWFFQNGFHAGQGTTSDNYGQAGRNVDFLFEVDGVHYPTKAKNMPGYTPSSNYKSNVLIGEDASEWVETAQDSGIYHWVEARQPEETEICNNWMEDNCKIGLTETSVPNNYFNLKVNIASSENVNNALFQKRYNDFLVYHSPAQAAQVAKHHDTYDNINDVIVKNTMEFVPAILFVRETGVDAEGNPVARNEFNDDKWHFYALGNMGDSKKSDYTRAYDPDDMNEFTCENSDNNTNNGQFQSGVFTYQGHEGAIETDYPAWRETIAYENGAIVVYNGMVYTRTGATQAALGENETYNWVAADWTAITYTGWTDQNPPYFAPRINPNPMEYTYPISSSQWNVKFGNNYLNRKHMTLVTEKFDGDHSFEFRYACKGDYRDGDLINDTNGNSTISDGNGGYRTNDDVQFDINHDVVLAMYEWLITADQTQYENEASQWFVKPAMEFFYAYTHYYTMMDNRAKNTFWHFAKTGIHRPVSRPVEALYHVYEVADGTVTVNNGVATGNFKKPEGSFNPNGTYYTQYAFDLWVYDCDTAAGIDNNGALVFPYGKEDEDYRVEGEPSSGYAFNGAGSIFWRRLKTTFADEIADVMNSTNKKCFNSEDLIKEFDDFQNCFPEEVWRLDIERKYIRTYTGASVDNSITEGKQNARFLMSMMQGRKKYQRRQWIRDQGFYFNSKYNIGDISTNRTEFNIVSPAGDHSLLAVQPDYHLRLTPYQDMYLNVVVGNGTPIPPIRAKANQEYTIKLDDYAAGNFAETRVYIGGFKMISKLGGLAPMYPYSFTLNGLDHLKELDVGTTNSGYSNSNFTELPLTNEVNLPLLETLNIQNCNALATSIGLKTANNLRTVEAIGSSIGGISLPEYTQIETLHLPSTVTDVVLHGAKFLKDFIVANKNGTENYSNVYTLNVYDSDYSINFKEDPSDPLPVDWIDVAVKVLEKQSPQTDLSLIGLYSATIGNIQELEPIVTAKAAIEDKGGRVELSGTINVTGNWSQTKIDTYRSIWHSPELNFNTVPANEIIEYKLTFYLSLEDQLNHNSYYISYLSVEEGELDTVLGDDPAYINLCPIPQKAATVSKSYFFGVNKNQYLPWSGWRFINSDSTPRSDLTIDEDMELVAVFGEEARTYPLRWYLNENDAENNYVYEILNVPYNSSYETGLAPSVLDLLTASKTTAQLNPDANHTYKIFKGWKKQPNNLDSTYLNNKQTAFCIYGDWEEGTESISAIKSQAQLDEKKLLVLTNTNDSPSILPTSSTYTVEMGYDNSTGTTIVGKNASLGIGPRGNAYTGESIESPILSFEWYNGGIVPTIRPVNDIKPFINMSTDGFTLAIDYQVDTTYTRSIFSSGYCIIGGCYFNDTANNIAQGFALYYDVSSDVIKVCFGNLSIQNTYSSSTSSRAITNPASANKRNIVVIRHKPGSNTLQFYSGISASNGILLSLDDDSFRQEITWSNNNVTSPLCFGHFTTSTFSALASVHPGVGASIHWAKYWNQDLGHNECTLLASWPHEKITFGLSDYSNDGNKDILVTNSKNLIFSALQLSQYSGPIMQSISPNAGNTVSWGNILKSNSNSTYKQIANQRFFLGLPIKLQAIASKTIGQAALITDSYNFYHIYEYTTSNETVDLAFLPTYYEVGGSREDYQSEALRSLPWYTAANTKIFSYGTSNFDFSTYTNNAQYMNLRFFGVPIKSMSGENNIFIGYTGSDPVYDKINIQNNPNGGITRGDIFIYTYTSNNSTTTTAYIYANDLDKAAGAPIIKASQGDLLYCESGGWIPAGSWWTRTPADTNGDKAVGSQPFFYIDGNTGVISYNSTPAENGAYFVYEFGI